MSHSIKGPAIFLAQFIGDEAPFNSLPSIVKWAADLGYKGVQIPTWDARIFDLDKAAASKTYCDEVAGVCAEHGVTITELSAHLQSQLVAVHPAYDAMFDAFAPTHLQGKPAERQTWAIDQVMKVAQASQNLGLTGAVGFTGSLAFPYLYPWPQRPQGLIKEAFSELARRWKPILDVYDNAGVDLGYEIHPGEDVFDGTTFERFLEKLDNHPRCQITYDPSHFLLQQLDYLSFIDIYHQRISAFHVKDAEFNPTGKQGVYSGYADWTERAGRFRSLGDGQVDFNGIFSRLTQYGFDGWAVLEWECCLKHPEQGAAEGVSFISDHIIRMTDKAFDEFAGGKTDKAALHKMMGF
jgi:sugar phosphate isomerase/epimerase